VGAGTVCTASLQGFRHCNRFCKLCWLAAPDQLTFQVFVEASMLHSWCVFKSVNSFVQCTATPVDSVAQLLLCCPCIGQSLTLKPRLNPLTWPQIVRSNQILAKKRTWLKTKVRAYLAVSRKRCPSSHDAHQPAHASTRSLL
jgi:hypothetical protein